MASVNTKWFFKKTSLYFTVYLFQIEFSSRNIWAFPVFRARVSKDVFDLSVCQVELPVTRTYDSLHIF